MDTIAEFKRRLKVGTKVATTWHNGEFAGRDLNGKAHYNSVELPTREVSIVQSNSFAFKTKRSNGEVVDSWCDFPKKSNTEFDGDSVTIIEEDRDGNRYPILTYKFIN